MIKLSNCFHFNEKLFSLIKTYVATLTDAGDSSKVTAIPKWSAKMYYQPRVSQRGHAEGSEKFQRPTTVNQITCKHCFYRLDYCSADLSETN